MGNGGREDQKRPVSRKLNDYFGLPKNLMTTTCVIKPPEGLDRTKAKGAVQDIAVFISANAGPKVESSAWKDASGKDTLKVAMVLEEFPEALVVVFEHARAPELKRSYQKAP